MFSRQNSHDREETLRDNPSRQSHQPDSDLPLTRNTVPDCLMSPAPQILVISGLPGAGKSTAARLLASRMACGAHVEADRLQEFIVSGSVWPDGSATIAGEAERQLRLRLHHACLLARSFAENGFFAVVDDIVIGQRLEQVTNEFTGVSFGFVMLLPDFEHVRQRWKSIGSPFVDGWEWIDTEIRTRTQKVGLWLDTTELTPDETVNAILDRIGETLVDRS